MRERPIHPPAPGPASSRSGPVGSPAPSDPPRTRFFRSPGRWFSPATSDSLSAPRLSRPAPPRKTPTPSAAPGATTGGQRGSSPAAREAIVSLPRSPGSGWKRSPRRGAYTTDTGNRSASWKYRRGSPTAAWPGPRSRKRMRGPSIANDPPTSAPARGGTSGPRRPRSGHPSAPTRGSCSQSRGCGLPCC